MTTWYYVDRSQTRQGPVDASVLVQAHARGEVDDASLAWREGLGQWAPLGQFRDELGLGAAAPMPPVPPPAPAYAASPVAAPEKKSGCGIVAIVLVGVGLFLIVLLGIAAAIALPAYQTYIVRTKVATAVIEARAAQAQVEAFVANTDRCPRDAAELGLSAPSSEAIERLVVGEANTGMCMIELELKAVEGAPDLAEGRIRLSRDNAGEWYCTSDLANRERLPADCR
ncbi:pilin [Arenimonas sp. MALMAid1274]|uniref:pilin n=1 Tax=Arenimonas sp. MALMAid1274 TaxID=3411630 RepID=UPI003BA152C3